MRLRGYHNKLPKGLLIILCLAVAGLAISIASVMTLTSDIAVIWNMAVNLAFFSLIAYIVIELVKALKRERELIRTDSLTRIANRRYFYELADAEIARLRRYKRPFTVSYIDVDNLKVVNYRFGYAAGDGLLQLVAQTMKSNTRNSDAISRVGGDEFVLLLPETGPEAAQVVLSRLRTRLLDLMQKNAWSVTFSFGVMTFLNAPDSVEDMLKKVSRLMYSAKDAGANMIDQEVYTKEA